MPVFARVGGRKVPVVVNCRGGVRFATAAEARGVTKAKPIKVATARRNPTWLQGSMPRHTPTGYDMSNFYDSHRKLRGELMTKGEEARFLLHNGRRRRKASR